MIGMEHLDIGKDMPPKQEGKCLETRRYSCFGYSLQGSSHSIKETPCQDYNDFVYLEDADVIVAGISDGVGSCPLSHWGSYIAVHTAIAYIKNEIKRISQREKIRFTDATKAAKILNQGFTRAMDAVEDLAEQQNRPVSALMSTLTLVLYDGEHLCCQHVGDDGVVAQFRDGSVEMITKRIKGEEASSVYPLQSGKEYWEFSVAGFDQRGPVVGFVMATDGVLDKFVMDDDAYRKRKGCCEGVYYPFMQRCFYQPNKENLPLPRQANETLSYYVERMNQKDYREQVTDDLTLVSIICPSYVKKSALPDFNKESFYSVTQEIRKRQREMLYSTKKSYDRPEKKEVTCQEKRIPENAGKQEEMLPLNQINEIGFTDAINEKRSWVIIACVGLVIGILIGGFVSYKIFGGKEQNSDVESRKTTVIQESTQSEKKKEQPSEKEKRKKSTETKPETKPQTETEPETKPETKTEPETEPETGEETETGQKADPVEGPEIKGNQKNTEEKAKENE